MKLQQLFVRDGLVPEKERAGRLVVDGPAQALYLLHRVFEQRAGLLVVALQPAQPSKPLVGSVTQVRQRQPLGQPTRLLQVLLGCQVVGQ